MKTSLGPKKGFRPDFKGVPGMLLDAAPDGLEFGTGKKRLSPYDPLLKQLQAAGAGKFLKFEDLRARTSVQARAKKLGIRVLFGEQGSVLWVTLASATIETEGTVEPQVKVTNADMILKAIADKRRAARLVKF